MFIDAFAFLGTKTVVVGADAVGYAVHHKLQRRLIFSVNGVPRIRGLRLRPGVLRIHGLWLRPGVLRIRGLWLWPGVLRIRGLWLRPGVLRIRGLRLKPGVCRVSASCLNPVGPHALTGLSGDLVIEIGGKTRIFRFPGKSSFHGREFDFSVPEFRFLSLVDMIYFEMAAVRKQICPPDFRDQWELDEILQLSEFVF